MVERFDLQNRRLLLLRLLDYGNATKQNLVQWTGLSNTTVSDTINAMLKTGFVRTAGMQRSIGGRRSVIYSINGEYGQFAGVRCGARVCASPYVMRGDRSKVIFKSHAVLMNCLSICSTVPSTCC